MNPFLSTRSERTEYLAVIAVVGAVTGVNLLLLPFTGYRVIAYLYLFVVLILAAFIQLSRGPTFLAAVLSALLWNYLFIPPRFTFHIHLAEDIMMFAMYFLIALLVGNLTARIRQQELAARRNLMVQESERLYKTLLNSISHELRTPITTIAAAASSLLDRRTGEEPAAQRALGEEIYEAAQRLNRLVNNLLDMLRVEAGRLRMKSEWCDVGDLFDVILTQLQKELAVHRVEVHLAPDLPLVQMDFVLMEQVLANLLLNASNYAPPGTSIRLAGATAGPDLVISVADQGPGISPEALPHVFDKFYRAPNAPPGGTGLGLSISRGIVGAHGGRIAAENLSEGGACFTIRLPLGTPPPVPQEAVA